MPKLPTTRGGALVQELSDRLQLHIVFVSPWRVVLDAEFAPDKVDTAFVDEFDGCVMASGSIEEPG